MFAIGAVIELMAIFYTIVRDAQPYFRELSAVYDLPLTMRLDKDALLAKADATKQFA